MTARAIGNVLAKELHVLLRPLGFTRKGETFSRDRDGFVELFHIRGSRWNSGELPWKCYLELGVRLAGILTQVTAQGIWRDAHAVGRVADLVPDSPSEFSISEGSVCEAAQELAQLIEVASTYLSPLLTTIRIRAMKGLISPIPIPASWSV